MGWVALFAQAKPDPFREPEVIWGTAGIAVALLVGAFAIWLVDRWRKKATAQREAAEELSDFREMYQQGQITEDEYAKLRNKVAMRVREKIPKSPDGVASAATGGILASGEIPPSPQPPETKGDGSRSPPV
ncbi:MAG: hypothetical protein C0467_10715 [Planctomycetaceae bacterium]|nr:hypothetical protein [Planctomycetaceae bacterium]